MHQSINHLENVNALQLEAARHHVSPFPL